MSCGPEISVGLIVCSRVLVLVTKQKILFDYILIDFQQNLSYWIYNPGKNIWNTFCSIIESNAWMKRLSLTPSNNVEVSLHTQTTFFIGVRRNCLICTCLFVPIYFGQDCLQKCLSDIFNSFIFYVVFRLLFWLTDIARVRDLHKHQWWWLQIKVLLSLFHIS